jgi:hypothetical protein
MGGSVAVLDWLKQQGVTLTACASDAAAEYGHMHLLQYLHAEGCERGCDVCEAAAERGDLVMLMWAYEHDHPWDVKHMCEPAAASSNIEMMSWLIHQPGVQLSARMMAAAVCSGNVAMCELLYENECPWDEEVCNTTAERDKADMLRWLREHGCPCDTLGVAHTAVFLNTAAILEYLQQEAVVFSAEQLTQWLRSVGARGNLAMAKCLRQQGAEWPAVLHRWEGGVLAWARAEGCISPEIDPGLWDHVMVRSYLLTQ